MVGLSLQDAVDLVGQLGGTPANGRPAAAEAWAADTPPPPSRLRRLLPMPSGTSSSKDGTGLPGHC